jgi:hypothetical protein
MICQVKGTRPLTKRARRAHSRGGRRSGEGTAVVGWTCDLAQTSSPSKAGQSKWKGGRPLAIL